MDLVHCSLHIGNIRYTYIHFSTIPCYTSFLKRKRNLNIHRLVVTFILHLINAQLDSALTYQVFTGGGGGGGGRGGVGAGFLKMYHRYTQPLILYNVCIVT